MPTTSETTRNRTPLLTTHPIGRWATHAVRSNAANGSRQNTTTQPTLNSSRYVSIRITTAAPQAKMTTPETISSAIVGRLASADFQLLASAPALSITPNAVVNECVPKLLGLRSCVRS